MHNQFELTSDQCIEMNKWINEHDKTCPFKTGELLLGAIGERITYKFTPTGLGMCVSLRCACGEWVDLTEYDKW